MMILAIDAGTTGVTALLVDETGKITERGYAEFPQHYPKPGWVEHDLNEIWQATLQAVSSISKENITAIGITNQRETVGIWDRRTVAPLAPAIVWQDRRTKNILEELNVDGSVQKITGLPLDPYFSASKIRWISKNNPAVWEKVLAGSAVVGTIDTFLIAKLTAGKVHATDASNASRTQVFDIHSGAWSAELLELFEIPLVALPEIVNSSGSVGITEDFFGLSVPISGIAGDQQAALFGQTQFEAGGAKCTYGTGAFILQNTGNKAILLDNGLITTVAWQLNGQLTYANEGSVFVSGAAVQWLRDELKIIESASEIESLALTVPDSEGVVFVPALTGLGAPYWIPDARGTVFGLTRGTKRGHLARATLDALAFQVRDVFDAMAETGVRLAGLRVDGGASANNLLMQIQSDLLQIPIERPKQVESTALGAAYLAGLGIGLWTMNDLLGLNPVDAKFEPQSQMDSQYKIWKKAVAATIDFAG
ncbi:MAG: glycerol kinase [Microbacteriaceae bacterium]|nr:glycerol kinase [Microbacteriaceae bacterium]